MIEKIAQLAGKYLGKGGTLRSVVKDVVPGSAITGGIAALTGGPVAGLAYGLGDLVTNVPLVAGARKLFPGVKGVITTAEGVTKSYTAPSAVESAVNLGASMLSPLAVDIATGGTLLRPQTPEKALADSVVNDMLTYQSQPQNASQEQQLYQQLIQRQNVNDLATQALAPGTMYQMQGMPERLSIGNSLGVDLMQEQRDYLARQAQILQG